MTSTHRILELLDNALETTSEDAYPEATTDKAGCLRTGCPRERADQSDFCQPCRSFLLGDTDDDPVKAHSDHQHVATTPAGQVGVPIVILNYATTDGPCPRPWVVTPWRRFPRRNITVEEQTTEWVEIEELGLADPVRIVAVSRTVEIDGQQFDIVGDIVIDTRTVRLQRGPVDMGRIHMYIVTAPDTDCPQHERQLDILGVTPAPGYTADESITHYNRQP